MENKANYPEMFFLFFAGSVLGFLLEGIWRVIRTGAWESFTGSVRLLCTGSPVRRVICRFGRSFCSMP